MNEVKEYESKETTKQLMSGGVYEVTMKYKKINDVGGKITSSSDAFNVLWKAQRDCDLERKEYFYCIYLQRNNAVLAVSQISIGGTTGTICDGKIIFSEALLVGAKGIILCHNHPSGTLKPSEADRQLTRKLCEFGRMIDMPILDHIIITSEERYISFMDEGMM